MDLSRLIAPRRVAHAHCDIPCGVYDPPRLASRPSRATGSSRSTTASDDPLFRARCLHVKEERAELTKHHIDVMWHDYFKPEHVEKYPDLHDVCWKASKQASQVKRTLDIAEAQKLLDLIDKIDEMWKGTGRPERDAPACLTVTGRLAGALVAAAIGTGVALVLRRPALTLIRSWAARIAVEGGSMAPTLDAGDWLLVDPDAYSRRGPRSGELVLVRDPRQADRLLVKRVASRVVRRPGSRSSAMRRGRRPTRGSSGRSTRPALAGRPFVPLLAASTRRPRPLSPTRAPARRAARTCSRSRGRKYLVEQALARRTRR